MFNEPEMIGRSVGKQYKGQIPQNNVPSNENGQPHVTIIINIICSNP